MYNETFYASRDNRYKFSLDIHTEFKNNLLDRHETGHGT